MLTFQDLINDILRIREAVNGIEVKGNQNAALLCYAHNKCDELIETLRKTANEIQNEQNAEPEFTVVESGEENGQQNSELP